MDSTLSSAALTGNIDLISSLINDQSTDQLPKLHTPTSNKTILFLASQSGHTEAVEAILSKHPFLLHHVNSDGDNALHLAARGGHADVVRVLIDCAKKLHPADFESGRGQLRAEWHGQMKRSRNMSIFNQYVKRGLLEAPEYMRSNSSFILLLKNKEGNTAVLEATRYNRIQVVAMLLEEDPGFEHSSNELGETPLYVAASRGFHDLVDMIIKACESPSCYGPDRRTALHGAVICNSKDCTTKLLQWDKSLVKHKDKYSQTPLHYAAQHGFANLVSELLSVDAYIGYVGNAKGRNVLHIAIEHEQKKVIEYLLEECPLLVNNLIIKKDNDGNTPLHLLATSNCFVPKVIHHPLADKGALNNKRLTPLDLVIYDDNTSSTAATKNEIAEELKHAGAILHSQNAPDYSRSLDHNDKGNSVPSDPRVVEIRKMMDNHMIVATLIATVAFTAGFAMPGGYIQSGSPNQGMAVLSRNSIAFQAFVISDAVALLCSTSALFTYFISTTHPNGKEILVLNSYASIGMSLNIFGLGAIIVAFITGTCAVLRYSHTLAIATCVVASLTFYMHLAVLLGRRVVLWEIKILDSNFKFFELGI